MIAQPDRLVLRLARRCVVEKGFPMMQTIDALRADLRREAAEDAPISSINHLVARLEAFSIGLRSQAPTLDEGARLFRVRHMVSKPATVTEVTAPPLGFARIGRLNEAGQSILYTSDTPTTAFAEIRATTGLYLLSEWRINFGRKVAFANGGIHLGVLTALFSGKAADGGFGQRTDNEDVLSLYREIFSLVPAENLALYNWSLACGRVNGFSNVCGRTNVEEIAGNTHFHGQYPFAGIAYASVRSDREAVNFAFNDLGMTFVSLNNAQWVQLQSDGSLTLMDLALPSPDGILHWQGRPTILQIEPGQRVRLLKVSENSWLVESLDGDLPLFT
jgi:hypothetical protein